MTLHWDAETCLWPFQLRSICSSPRDLNLDCWEIRMGAEQLGLSWQHQRASVVFLMCTIYIEDSLRQFDALLARLHQQSMLIFATDCPGSSEINAWALSTTVGILAMRSFEWLFFAGILEPSLNCSKVRKFDCSNILPQRQFKESNYFHCWAFSAKVFDDRGSSSILRIWFQHRGHFENMTTVY